MGIRRINANEAWVKANLVRAEHGQPSEVSVTIPMVGNFRIFRAGREWLTYLHRERRDWESKPEALRDLFRFEPKGEIENRTETRERAILWLALHYEREIEAAQ